LRVLFQTFNDGKWHSVEFAMSKNYAVLIIDNEKAETRRILVPDLTKQNAAPVFKGG
jgi:hypothetical protein